ncbi:hypothetical protein B0H17DRAFT_1135463 [Mycena rosella]|uniref:Uncharacterized protein n=1 Tax=Mycena rosella TaxID=1033263 RepID=A0AAD7DF05_MYCRO|nr:hypothetical protein B0H17DRAFT_1135463 [Mycena rosella]
MPVCPNHRFVQKRPKDQKPPVPPGKIVDRHGNAEAVRDPSHHDDYVTLDSIGRNNGLGGAGHARPRCGEDAEIQHTATALLLASGKTGPLPWLNETPHANTTLSVLAVVWQGKINIMQQCLFSVPRPSKGQPTAPATPSESLWFWNAMSLHGARYGRIRTLSRLILEVSPTLCALLWRRPTDLMILDDDPATSLGDIGPQNYTAHSNTTRSAPEFPDAAFGKPSANFGYT